VDADTQVHLGLRGGNIDIRTQWEEFQRDIRKACGMREIVVTIFEKYNLPQSTLQP
jgi:hypothetical protein